MSNLVNELLGKVSALTQTVNQLLSKSKSIPELPSQNILDSNSLLHVSKGGTSEKITVQQIINAAVNRDNDQLLTVGAMSLTGNDFTIDAISWKINNIVHDVSTPVTINIPFCPTGLNRIDLIIADSNGNITRQAGAETAGAIIIAPTLLVGNLLITQVSVSDSVIGNPSNPILGSTYQQKQFDALQTYIGSGTDVVIPLNTEGRSHIQLKGTMTSIAGLSFADLVANPTNAEYPHYGKRFLFFNDSGHDIILKHLVGTEDIFFTFKEETDLVFPNGEFLEFFNGSNVFVNVFRSWKDISNKLDKVTTTDVEKVYIKNADGTQGMKPVSELGGGGTVQSVTGDSVDNTDTLNPIINAIPLSGTTVGNPVKGDIEIKGTDYHIGKIFQSDPVNELNFSLEFNTDTPYFGLKMENFGSLRFNNIDITDEMQFITTNDSLKVSSKDAILGGRGITGEQDYSANIADLDYTQKKYVDDRGSVLNTTTAVLSASDLNTAYPNAKDGFSVICPNVVGGGKYYIKAGAGWVYQQILAVV